MARIVINDQEFSGQTFLVQNGCLYVDGQLRLQGLGRTVRIRPASAAREDPIPMAAYG